MAETANIAEVAAKISTEIFQSFLWELHPKKDDNFKCGNDKHKTSGKQAAPLKTHPGDAVFVYTDPYLGKRIYLHTDLKSYGAQSITSTALRSAFKSLCMTTECANNSDDWRMKYSVDNSEQHEVRGLLFVYNHDAGYEKQFAEVVKSVSLSSLPMAANTTLHYLGPDDILRLYTISNDMVRLRFDGRLATEYTFYYPDLVLSRRQGDVWNQPAMVESLTGPYLIIRHRGTTKGPAGYIIYYNRKGDSVDEFEYFLDSLSHYQMLESGERILIRVTARAPSPDLKSVFHTAKKKYVKAWGFDSAREAILDAIEIDTVVAAIPTYNPGFIGWRD